MACGRCGQSKPAPKARIGRPGANGRPPVVPTPATPAGQKARDAIMGLKYVPSNK